MRCLFFVEDYPITPDSAGGAPALNYSHLELLAHAGVEIHMVTLTNPRRQLGFREYVVRQPEVWARVEGWCASHGFIRVDQEETASEPLRNFARAMRDPVRYVCPEAQEPVVEEFRKTVARLRPDFIWAEHRVPAMLAARAATGVPVVYSHHDWEWALRQLRHEAKKGTLDARQDMRARFGVWQTKRAEHATVRGVAACVSGSVTEAAEFREIGARRAAYFPTTYEPVALKDDCETTGAGDERVRVVHLGGMQGSRNQSSVNRFLEHSWFPTCDRHHASPELWMVGSMKSAPEEFMDELRRARAVCTGFVRDLADALRPGDIHVVPWEFAGGTRTRIPVALNHAQALVSTRAAASCLPELRDGENCLLVEDLGEMGRAIAALLDDPARRKRIARAGRETFLRHFTREALQPRFQQFVEELCVNNSTAQSAFQLRPSRAA